MSKSAKDSGRGPTVRYIEDYRSDRDTESLKGEGYEIEYNRLLGIGQRSAMFIGHALNVPKPPLVNGVMPTYTPEYDLAAKVLVKKHLQSATGPMKCRTRNLKLALALGRMRRTDSKNMLKMYDVFITKERIFIFMQYCIYGNCVDFLRKHGRITEEYARKWAIQMATALEFLHRYQVSHKNYKLENVLIDDKLNAKLTGFGFSKFIIDFQTNRLILSKTICGRYAIILLIHDS